MLNFERTMRPKSNDAAAIYDDLRSRETLVRLSESARKKAPLYSVLYRAIAEDDHLFGMSCQAQPGQMAGMLMLSAVHYHVLNNPDEPLADYFASVRPAPKPPSEAGPIFAAFCRTHEEQILDIIQSRTLQTTSMTRAMSILLSMDHVAKQVGEPFSIIEIGCSAGLLLLFDHYRYDFGNEQILAPEAAPFTARAEFVGRTPPPPKAFPSIARRIGLDLAPLDPRDRTVRNWVLALTIADWPEEVESLRSALEYRARTPVEVVTGDALETLPPLLDAIPGPLCVFHSQCLYQWPPEARARLDDLLRRRGQKRVIHRIGIEMVGDALASTGVANLMPVEIIHNVYAPGARKEQLLGRLGSMKEGYIEWIG